jgi:hypothetical protein
MKKVGKAALLLALAFGPPAFSASDSSQTETCRDLIASVKASDCMKPVARFLDGATVVLGFGLHSSRMTLKRNDSTVASLTGILTPAPYYGFSLPKRFFGSTRFGWEVSLAYGSSVAVYQNISRNDKNHIVDLGTYGSVTLGAISPSVFFAWGARDEDPTVNMRFGLGLGLGLGSVRGTAYYTEISEGGEIPPVSTRPRPISAIPWTRPASRRRVRCAPSAVWTWAEAPACFGTGAGVSSTEAPT